MFVLKRIYQLSMDPGSFNYYGSGKDVTFKNRPWSKYSLPSDPEIIACVFTSFLDGMFHLDNNSYFSNHLITIG